VRPKTALLVAALVPLAACAELHQSPKPAYTATCIVSDAMDSGHGHPPVGSFMRTVHATGETQEQLRNSLQAQGVGTSANPCLDLTIAQLPLRRDVRFGPAVAPASAVAPPTFVVHFASGSAEIPPAGRAVIAEAAHTILRTGVSHVRIVGHTDTAGSDRANQRLSERRAQAVLRALLAADVPQGLVSTRGAGERELFIPTDDDVHEPYNRRVEISVQ
jgi:outer membrane protein OmpA-like peptidoglycan-associated protein